MAGVASGLAGELGLEPIWVRLGFVLLLVAGGWGAMAYLVAWGVMVLVDYRHGAGPPVPKARSFGRRLAGFGCVVLGLFVFLARLPGLPIAVMAPIGLLGAGALVALDRLTLGPALGAVRSDDRPWRGRAQLLTGVVAALVALPLLVGGVQAWTGAGVVAALGIGFGVGLVALSAPWWWRLLTDLDAERAARIRSDERAEVAAHLHDSVLQTLTLIQQDDDPARMVALARRQERELRNWLDPDRVGRTGGGLRSRRRRPRR